MPLMTIGAGRTLLRSPAVVGGITTVFDLTLTGTDPGWSGAGFVQVIPAGSMGAGTGTRVRLTLKFVLLSAGATAAVFIAQQAAAGDAFDFLNTPLNVLFSGTNITGDGTTLDYVSDFGNLPEAYDETKAYIIAVDFNSGTISLGKEASTGASSFFGTTGTAATVDKSGYSANLTDTVDLVTKIEIQ